MTPIVVFHNDSNGLESKVYDKAGHYVVQLWDTKDNRIIVDDAQWTTKMLAFARAANMVGLDLPNVQINEVVRASIKCPS